MHHTHRLETTIRSCEPLVAPPPPKQHLYTHRDNLLQPVGRRRAGAPACGPCCTILAGQPPPLAPSLLDKTNGSIFLTVRNATRYDTASAGRGLSPAHGDSGGEESCSDHLWLDLLTSGWKGRRTAIVITIIGRAAVPTQRVNVSSRHRVVSPLSTTSQKHSSV